MVVARQGPTTEILGQAHQAPLLASDLYRQAPMGVVASVLQSPHREERDEATRLAQSVSDATAL